MRKISVHEYNRVIHLLESIVKLDSGDYHILLPAIVLLKRLLSAAEEGAKRKPSGRYK